MGQDDDLYTSLAHIAIIGVAGRGVSHLSGRNWTHPGMHGNLLIHGLVGLVHYQSGSLNQDVSGLYSISLSAARYLPLACLMADLNWSNKNVASLHLLTGAVPFVMDITGNSNPYAGNIMIGLNIATLCYYSLNNKREWGWYCAGAGLIAYFAAPQSGVKVLFPLALALMEYCAYRMFRCTFDIPIPTTRKEKRAAAKKEKEERKAEKEAKAKAEKARKSPK